PHLIDEPVMDKDPIVSEAPSAEQATEEPSVLPPTSSPSSSNVEEEFELSNFMFEDEGNHDEQVSNQEETMEE
ncbi:hypothetical protein KI387_005146, partial [Taxus chinensis]